MPGWLRATRAGCLRRSACLRSTSRRAGMFSPTGPAHQSTAVLRVDRKKCVQCSRRSPGQVGVSRIPLHRPRLHFGNSELRKFLKWGECCPRALSTRDFHFTLQLQLRPSAYRGGWAKTLVGHSVRRRLGSALTAAQRQPEFCYRQSVSRTASCNALRLPFSCGFPDVLTDL